MSRLPRLLSPLLIWLCAFQGTQAAIVQSPFDSSLEDWSKLPGSDAASTVEWLAASGNPGGFLRFHEVGIGFIDYAAAPNMFLGDKRAFYGGALSFDIRIDTLLNPTNRNDQVRLTGAGITLRYQVPNPSPTNTWHRRFTDLTETAGWINVANAQPPSQSQMLAVLGDLTGLHLLADYRTGSEAVDYDNVRLIPFPSLPGDYNLNNIVDAADFVLWRKHLGTGFQLENEVLGVTRGSVTLEDYVAWRARFGNTAGAGAVVHNGAVHMPEPATLPFAIIGVAAALRKTARRRSLRR